MSGRDEADADPVRYRDRRAHGVRIGVLVEHDDQHVLAGGHGHARSATPATLPQTSEIIRPFLSSWYGGRAGLASGRGRLIQMVMQTHRMLVRLSERHSTAGARR